ncbi:hypothetical protein G7A72_15790 [Flavobacterium sp. Sr18]|uniref:hypothetical protein n=1 Tax=Flavobacterium sp. Sr18 TaxID=935222 RepID=UPI0013E48976|nr:hypothetical protein [Flavobacterium sp. Sr18]QIH40180.1 hypothetical protein G7A72_15790 [Flavobacterium sp. Sr18]
MSNFSPKSGGQFGLENGGQFAPKLVVNLNWNRVVNLTGFSNLNTQFKEIASNLNQQDLKTLTKNRNSIKQNPCNFTIKN